MHYEWKRCDRNSGDWIWENFGLLAADVATHFGLASSEGRGRADRFDNGTDPGTGPLDLC